MAADREIDRYRSLAAAQRQQQESDLVRQYAPLVKRIAHHLSHRLPSTVEFDDLLQAGTLGLLEAARKYNPAEGASFETFAGIRIRGAMIDEVRPMDWTPRSVHRKSREFSEAVRALEHRLGRTPRDQEVMAELGLDAQRYHDALRDTASTKLVSYEAICPPGRLIKRRPRTLTLRSAPLTARPSRWPWPKRLRSSGGETKTFCRCTTTTS